MNYAEFLLEGIGKKILIYNIMKYLKTFEQSKFTDIKYYYSSEGYMPIFLYDGENILAFITPGSGNGKFMTPGTIWRDKNKSERGTGTILYKLLINLYGKVVPSDNISDNAKKMFMRLMSDNDIKVTKFDIGYRYDEEQYLNNIMEVNKSIELPEMTEMKDESVLDKVENTINKVKNDLFANEEENYTIGQSKVRDELLLKSGKYSSVGEIAYELIDEFLDK